MKSRTIGKLAKEANVGVETVRFYERKGILRQPPKPPEGYRSYSERDLVTIGYIKEAEGLNFSLDDVQQLMARAEKDTAGFCTAVRGVARKKLREVKRRIAELEELQANLEDFLVKCAARGGPKNCPILARIRTSSANC
jgi:MerR family transcriptional regulator, mercuric resistance operon regulatory protein